MRDVVYVRSYGVMVSTLDSESSDPGSNPGMSSSFALFEMYFVEYYNYAFYMSSVIDFSCQFLQTSCMCYSMLQYLAYVVEGFVLHGLVRHG
jgi:hypothetical protein